VCDLNNKLFTNFAKDFNQTPNLRSVHLWKSGHKYPIVGVETDDSDVVKRYNAYFIEGGKLQGQMVFYPDLKNPCPRSSSEEKLITELKDQVAQLSSDKTTVNQLQVENEALKKELEELKLHCKKIAEDFSQIGILNSTSS